MTNAQLRGNGQTPVSEANLALILAGLQTVRDGDFSVRLPGHLTGLAGKVADTFNEIVSANQQIALRHLADALKARLTAGWLKSSRDATRVTFRSSARAVKTTGRLRSARRRCVMRIAMIAIMHWINFRKKATVNL